MFGVRCSSQHPTSNTKRVCLAVSLLLHLLLFGPASSGKAAEGLIGLGAAGNEGDGRIGLSPLSAEIRRRIEKAKFYPDLARDRGIEGTVELLFTLSADGSLREVKVLRSSGSPILDEAAVEAIRRAAPYPVMMDWPATLELRLSITYRLSE